MNMHHLKVGRKERPDLYGKEEAVHHEKQERNKKNGERKNKGRRHLQRKLTKEELEDFISLESYLKDENRYIPNTLPRDPLLLDEFHSQYGWLPERQRCCEWCHYNIMRGYGCHRCRYDTRFWITMATGEGCLTQENCGYASLAHDIDDKCIWCAALQRGQQHEAVLGKFCLPPARLVLGDRAKMLPKHYCGENPQQDPEGDSWVDDEDQDSTCPYPVDVPIPLNYFTLGDYLPSHRG
jgi:hypothetical protein